MSIQYGNPDKGKVHEVQSRTTGYDNEYGKYTSTKKGRRIHQRGHQGDMLDKWHPQRRVTASKLLAKLERMRK